MSNKITFFRESIIFFNFQAHSIKMLLYVCSLLSTTLTKTMTNKYNDSYG